MTKRTKILLPVLALLLGGIYIGLWLYSAQWFTREIDNLYANAQEEGIEFLGPKPRLTNFPFVPTIVYNGGVKTGNIEVLFPAMVLRGYPIPFTTLHLNFPLGIMLGGDVDPAIWSLDQLEARLEIPYRLPQAMTQEDLSDWHAHGGKIDVRSYRIKKETLISEGKGLLALDDALQPVFSFESRISGYEEFIHAQQDKGLIERLPAAIALGVLGSLAKADEATGQQTVTLHSSVQNRILTVGPLQVLALPVIAWDTRTPPAPHQ